MPLLIATFNPGKAGEIERILRAAGLQAAGFQVVGLREAGVEAPYEERGSTYEENALGKARHYARLSGRITVADDSGIEVEALSGRPGPLSSRYGGPGADDAGRCGALLGELEGVPEERRGARYVAVAAIARPDGSARSFRGECAGRIAFQARGPGGFGYDPVFYYPPFGLTFGEAPAERKDIASHRGLACRALVGFLLTKEGRRFLTRAGLALLAGLLLVAPAPALAHHGKAFLLAESYDLPRRGEVYLVPTFDLVDESGRDETGASPSVLLGVTPSFAVELHGHFEKAGGEAWHYAATAPAVHFRFAPRNASALWHLGLSAEYEIAHPQEGTDRLEGRLIVAREKDDANVTFNLVAERDEGGQDGTDWAYAIGFRPDLDRRLGWGLEGQGEFRRQGAHEVLVGVYGEPTEQLTLKIGLGAGLGPEAPDFTLRAGLVWRF